MRTSQRLSSPAVLWPVLLTSTAFLGWVDFITGHELHFFVFYFLPVCLAGWRLGLTEAVIVSLLSAATWFYADFKAGHSYASHLVAVWNTLIRLSAFLFVGWAMARLSTLLAKERALSESLQESLAQIRVLEGIVPICASCKKIRNETGAWEQMEAYIRDRTHAEFSHGICPACARKMLAEAGIRSEHFDVEP